MEHQSFSDSFARGTHHHLQQFAGTWKGVSKVWLDPDGEPDEAPVEGTLESILEGRFLLHRYRSQFKDQPLEGLYLIGFDLMAGQFQVAWVDSFHMSTGIMFSKGNLHDHDLQVLGSYSDYQQPPQFWGWRTDMHMEGEELVIVAFNITPAGQSAKATEVRYKRVV